MFRVPSTNFVYMERFNGIYCTAHRFDFSWMQIKLRKQNNSKEEKKTIVSTVPIALELLIASLPN